MSEDTFTEITNESWFSRIGGAIKGILFGLFLLVIAFPLLFWNEGRTVKQYKNLKEGGSAVVSVAGDTVDAANSGKLIHITGKAETDATLSDAVFGVSANALKLNRVVEMYQWKEASRSQTKKKVGGGKETVRTYTYSKTWSEKPISSANFKKPTDHQNPGAIPFESTKQIAVEVSLGAFTLSRSLVGKINNFTPLAIENETSVPETLKDKCKVYDGGFYIGADSASAQVGDVRVTFMVAKPTDVSVVAKQVDGTFEAYATKVGGSIELLQAGVHTATAMIQTEQKSNKALAWALRLVGSILMLVGLNMIFKPLSVIADILPILGTIVGVGTGIISFLLAAILSLITIAVAWIVYRPLLGIILIGVAGGLAFAVMTKLKTPKVAL
jgi:hypothetical protein